MLAAVTLGVGVFLPLLELGWLSGPLLFVCGCTEYTYNETIARFPFCSSSFSFLLSSFVLVFGSSFFLLLCQFLLPSLSPLVLQLRAS